MIARIAALAASFLLLMFAPSALGAEQLEATPPMGWNSWNHFGGNVTDADVRGAADALVSSGMRNAGYIYVNIDDTWQGKRDAQGVIHPNNKFPGMKALADYVHSKGLKLGIYSSPGPKTCAGYEGSYGHEAQDAKTYAAWGIDYLKYDECSFGDIIERESHGDRRKAAEIEMHGYEKMHQALVATGRPIVFSVSSPVFYKVWEWGSAVGGNLWRTTGDIGDHYYSMATIGFSQAGLAKYAGPGHWNDPDMLEVGNGGMTEEEYRTHMSLWAILAAPLIAGNDLTKMSPETLALLTNKDVIAVDQDKLGRQGDRVWAVGPMELWDKPLSGGAKAVAMFNREDGATSMAFSLSDVGFRQGATLKDLWTGKEVHARNGSYAALVPAHGVVLLRVSQ